MAKSIVVLGTQWGDEGKGKIVDLLTDQVQAVARFKVATMRAIRWLRGKPFFTSTQAFCVKGSNV